MDGVLDLLFAGEVGLAERDTADLVDDERSPSRRTTRQ